MRKLTNEEVMKLERQGCWAEDWNNIRVADTFTPEAIRQVDFYGHITLGHYDQMMEIKSGCCRPTGIRKTILCNVDIGDNCLIENVGQITTTAHPTFGEGTTISTLNEVGPGNVVIFSHLNAQLAALMVKYERNHPFTTAIRSLISEHIARRTPQRTTIAEGVCITDTTNVTDCNIGTNCIIEGAARLLRCTLQGTRQAPVRIGVGAICQDSVVYAGSSVANGAKIKQCFLGEACHITDGFSAESSVFFANCYMSNGEACAAFCGPFSASHHKSSLLIGGMYSFYNAGSNTNFSNHAYKMGPMHWGILERGTKTASGAYVLMPAQIGTFSVCFGKLMHHPDTRRLPFSYLIAYNDDMYLIPGRNLTTVGLYRDIRKWPGRDRRSPEGRNSIINFDWLSPFSVGGIVSAKHTLEALREAGGNTATYNYHDYIIKNSSLRKGIKYYDIALRIFMGAVLKRHRLEPPRSQEGAGAWSDLSGLLLPLSQEEQLVEDIKWGRLASIEAINARLTGIHANYAEYRWAWSYRLICDHYDLNEITVQDAERVREDYIQARRAWIAEIRKDAQKEFELGDVDETLLQDFLQSLDREVEFENLKYDM